MTPKYMFLVVRHENRLSGAIFFSHLPKYKKQQGGRGKIDTADGNFTHLHNRFP